MTKVSMTFINLPVSNLKDTGGSEPRSANDYGFMYQRTLADPDGHRWEPFYMDMTKMPKQ